MSEKLQRYRFLKKFLPKPQRKGLVILTGARQTGKTTLVKERYADLRYVNLDSPENRQILRAVVSDDWSRDVGNAVIDEAQKEPVVFEKVKYAFDEGSISFSVLTGSSQILLLKKIRESLAGRVSVFELWPLMMSELRTDVDTKKIELPLIDLLLSSKNPSSVFEKIPKVLLIKDDSPLRRTEKYILRWGGMPALLSLTDEERRKWLKDYEYTYLERDLSDLARLDDLEPFRKFQKLTAARSAKLLNYSELARDASVSVDTARRYLEYLRLSYQVILLQPYFKNITSSVIKTPKLYWLDVGLLRQLSGYQGEVNGEIYETMVVSELIKWIKTTQRDCEVFFYRTRSGFEVDIFIQTAETLMGMEIKSRQVVVSADARSLKEVAQGLGNKWKGGLIIYQGNEIKKVAEPDIWAVPSRRLF